MLRARAARSGPPSPSPSCPGPLYPWWPRESTHISWISVAAGSPTRSSGASKPYLLARLVLGASATLGCLCELTVLLLFATVPRCGICGAAGPGPPVISLSLPLSPHGGGSIPSPLPSVLTRHSVSIRGHSGVFILPGQPLHSRGVDAPWQLDSP